MTDKKDNAEAQQLQVLEIYRKLIQAILLRHKSLILMAFLAAFIGVLTIIHRLVTTSQYRYKATTALIFYPKHTGKIESIDEKQVMRIFSRRLMIQKLSEDMNMNEEERGNLASRLEIRQDDRQKNLYVLVAKAANREDAIRTVNLLADLCIREYVAFRTEDLGKWSETVSLRKKELADALKKNEDEAAEITHKTGISAPEQELERVRNALAQQKSNRSNFIVQMANAKANQSNIEQIMKDVDKNFILNVSKISAYETDLKHLNDEIYTLEQLYTEKNPKVAGLIDRKNELKKEYEEFLKEKNIRPFNPELLNKVGSLQEKLQNILLSIETIKESISLVDSEIKANEETIKNLSIIIPQVIEISHERDSLQKSLRALDDDTAAINYLLASVHNDMSQVELCESAIGENPFSNKNVILALLAGAIAAGFMAIFIAFTGILFGKVYNMAELSYYPELKVLGAIPASSKNFSSEKDERTVLDSIFYNFDQVNAPKKVVLLGTLPGAKYLDFLKEAMEWNYAMSGKRILLLKIVQADSFVEPEKKDLNILGAVYYAGNEGTMPVENIHTLSPSEMLLLQSDIKELQEQFDTILISREEPLRKIGVFFSQMLNYCDSAIILVGSRRTQRSMLRYVINKQRETNRCIMSLLTHAKEISARRA